MNDRNPGDEWWRGAGLALVATTLFSLANPAQPVLENYVGRQVPTAMVARNLARGSGFLRPRLDTGPFPNLFLVEPPIDAGLVATLHRLSGLGLTTCGRLISASAMGLAGWGLFGLTRRRGGIHVARIACVVFWTLPVCLRYGRAMQPDALMLGLLLAGLRLWDDFEAGGGRMRLATAWGLIAAGLAVKLISAYVLVPLVLTILRRPRRGQVVLAAATLAPALLWYAYATIALGSDGSRASADNAGRWMEAMSASALFRRSTYLSAARIVFWRAFTPIGVPLAAWGFLRCRRDARLWRVWAASAALAFVALSGKIHHEYYWLAWAPLVAVGSATAATDLGSIPSRRAGLALPHSRGQGEPCPTGEGDRGTDPTAPRPLQSRATGIALVMTSGLVLLSLAMARGTYRTPPEWSAWPQAVAAIEENVPGDSLLVAPEALIFLADRKGCRLEHEPTSRLRAAGEWGEAIDPDDPLALVEFYRSRGARFVADLWPAGDEPDRRTLHAAIRRRYNVKVDRDGVILAELTADPAR